jgi:hypothetical protein
MAGLLLSAAELKNCRQSRDDSASTSAWAFDGRGGISASTDLRATGTVTLTCRVRFAVAATAVRLRHEKVLVSFVPSRQKTTGDGLQIETRGAGSIAYLRVAGEDWIESRLREWTLPLNVPQREVMIVLRLIDTSRHVPVRVDIQGLTVEAIASVDARIRDPQIR